LATQLRVLGSPEVIDRDGSPVSLSLGKPLALLIYVACNSSPVSREEMADLLWPEAGRQKGRHSVRQALWVLRNAIGEDIFESHDPLSLKEGVLELDLHRFTIALSEGRVEDARTLWRGPVLDHFVLASVRHWIHWTDELRSDLEHRFSKALLQHARLLTEQGEADAAVSTLSQAIEVASSYEAPHLARIELLLDLLRLGAAGEALADAHQVLGDHPGSTARLAIMEERLNQIIQEQRARVTEGESFPLEFVGRGRELAGLHTLWGDADLGRTRVAVITGPSGIGKTRLAQELLSYVSGADIRSVPLKGSRAGRKLRWGAISDFVRQLLRLPGSAGISSASDSLLRAMLPSMGKDAINLQTVNGVSPAAILDAVSDLLDSITFEAPLVVLLDDFQWMDQDSQTLFIGLANHRRELRVLFLILGRSGLSSRHWEDVESSLVEEAGARRFLLKPLIEEEVGELLALGAAFPRPEDAPGIVAKIHQASAGNPLFIREILGELHETGILQREGAGWVFYTSEIPEEFELPENIQLLLRERLDRLSEPAANLAATLARKNQRTSSETLEKETQLPSGVFTEAVAELLERGVVEWVDGTSLDFVHDLLRDTATTHLAGSLPGPPPEVGWLTRNQGILALAIGILMALPLGILWGRGALPWETEPDPPLFGGGTILFLRQGNPPILMNALASPPEEWQLSYLDPEPPPGTRDIFRAPGGGFLWFGATDHPEGPDMTRILPDGSHLTLFPEPGDEVLYDLSPDGSRILFVSENVGRQPFSHSLYQGGISTGRKQLIYEGHGPVEHARWSTDGDLVAFSARAASDTLAVYSLLGEEVGTVTLGDVHGLTWCGSSLVASASLGDATFLLRVRIPEMTLDTLGRVEPETKPSCSPDGSALAYMGVVDRRLAPVLLELESGEVHPLPMADGQVFLPRWLPDQAPVIPLMVRAERDTIRIDWGEERGLSASIHFSDGSRSEAGIRWESLGPAVATVGPYQELTGNGAGVTPILARWGYSLVDTIVVEVEDVGPEWAVLSERFPTLDTTRWIPVGFPPAEVVTEDGEQVLHLKGDEKYTDGIVLRSPLSLSRGITIEMEFKMNVTRTVHQSFGFCIRDTNPEEVDREQGGFPNSGAEVCIRYPAQEFEKLDLTEASIWVTPGRKRRVRAPESFPPDDWTHLALQVRADGEATLVVNRQRLVSNPIRLHTPPESRWTLIVEGDAIGTDIYVRNLTIWLGERY
jgi:DNA-binding SARP family transcriptional activator